MALDLALEPIEIGAAAAGSAAADGPGRKCHSAMAVDSRRGREKPGDAGANRASLFRLAGWRRQCRAKAGAQTPARFGGSQAAAQSRDAARIVAGRAGLLRAIQCALSQLPVSGVGPGV